MQRPAHGGDVYSGTYRADFSVSISPLGVPVSVRRAYAEAADAIERYPDIRQRALREALSGAFHVPEERILCSAGAAELIYAAAYAARPGTALLVTPCFSEYESALRNAGCNDIRYYVCREENGFQPEADLPERITDDLDMFFLCSPANPTGVLIPDGLMEQIVRRCAEKDVFLVLDECYVGLLPHPESVSMLRHLEDGGRMLILNAFTKTFAMPGLRLGFGMCSDRRLAERIRPFMQPWNISCAASACGIAALGDHAYLQRARDAVSGEMRYLKEAFDRMGIRRYGSEANYLFFRGPEDLYTRCAERGILIRDCSNYRGLGPGYFRIACRTHEEDAMLCGILREILGESKAEPGGSESGGDTWRRQS